MRHFRTTEQFIEKAKKIHGDKYDYSKVNYVGSTTKIEITCKKHGNFMAFPNMHLQGVGCPECSYDRKRITNDEYIKKCKKFHEDKYDYSKTIYVDWKTNVTVTCPIHGDFNIRAIDHKFRGCQKCGYEQLAQSKRKEDHKSKYYTYGRVYGIKVVNYFLDDFIFDSKNKHGDRYDYSLVEFENKYQKVKIICKEHGIFEQLPYSHINGAGCPKCINKKSQEQFVKECNEKHNNEYDYSLVKYINTTKKIKIICKKHGEFEQIAGHHLSGCKCPICRGVKRKDTDSFIKEAIDTHGERYDYSLVDYINRKSKVKIICKEHGVFEQYAEHHLNGSGCPECRNSKGENAIIQIFKNLEVEYKRQKTFAGCGISKRLQFDFYLPKYNICIEFDGKQHYEPVDWFGGVEGFEKTQERDNIKTNFCIKNNIPLIRIRYDDNISDKLSFLKDI